MIWGHVHCALPRYDYSFCDQWKIRNCAFQEQFLTKSAKFAIVNTHEKRFERCPYLQFFCCFFSVKLGGCRWQRLFMEETKSGKNTLCATAESWDSIRLNCSPTPPPCNKKLASWKIPHAPPQKKQNVNTATAKRPKSWRKLEIRTGGHPWPKSAKTKRNLRETNLSCTLTCIATETVDLQKLHYHLQRKNA